MNIQCIPAVFSHLALLCVPVATIGFLAIQSVDWTDSPVSIDHFKHEFCGN